MQLTVIEIILTTVYYCSENKLYHVVIDDEERLKRHQRKHDLKDKFGPKSKSILSGISNASGRTSILSAHSSLQSGSLDPTQFRPPSTDTIAGFPDLSK